MRDRQSWAVRGTVVGGLAVSAMAALAVYGCSSSTRAPSGFETVKEAGVEAGPVEAGPALIGDDASSNCGDLQCMVDTTCGDSPTTLTGKVYDPAGTTPLYNAIVYIPRTHADADNLPPIKDATTDGVTCERCGATAINPLAVAITNTKGEFTLTDVPVDKNVPVVVQIGKWRRKMTLDIDKRCDVNQAPSNDRDKVLRLPRNGKEGDMPNIAVTTGGCDQLECLLRGMGVDDSEFVPGASTAGHIHMFQGSGGGGGFSLGTSDANKTFWNDSKNMLKYDISMLSCECSDNTPNPPGTSADFARLQMIDYVNKGGRVFASHYHVTWMKNAPDTNFKNVATFPATEGSAVDGIHYIETQLGIGGVFPKGQAMAEWLFNIKASSKLGEISLTDTRAGVLSTNALLAQAWIKTAPPANAPRYFSFNTPIGAADDKICGRFVFADLHVMQSSGTFPTSCPAPGGLNAQQKALEFMFFDLSSCVQSDKIAPVIPK